jgi:hypothetical protein
LSRSRATITRWLWRRAGLQTWSIDWNAEGEAQTIYAVRNPDKLERLRTIFADLAG